LAAACWPSDGSAIQWNNELDTADLIPMQPLVVGNEKVHAKKRRHAKVELRRAGESPNRNESVRKQLLLSKARTVATP